MSKISRFTIEGFRGVRELEVNGLDRVNLIIGDNECGKTSILEALQLLRAPGDVANAFRVARLRENSPDPGISLFDQFVCMFPRGRKIYNLGISATLDGHEVGCRITGKQKRVILNSAELKKSARYRDHGYARELESAGELEADSFRGELRSTFDTRSSSTTFEVNTFTHTTGAATGERVGQRINYLSPFEHYTGGAAAVIARNEGYKDICIRLLNQFDPDIIDLLVLQSPLNNRPLECVRHRTLGIIPLAMCGNGIKRALALASAVARSSDGILLIDEVEAALSKQRYDDVFPFLIRASRAFNVQLFLTVQSTEAIDALFATQRYAEQRTADDLRVVAIWKDEAQSYSHVLPGRAVVERSEAGYEA